MQKPKIRIQYYDSGVGDFVNLDPLVKNVRWTTYIGRYGDFVFEYPLTNEKTSNLVDRVQIKIFELDPDTNNYVYRYGGKISRWEDPIVANEKVRRVIGVGYLVEFTEEVTVPNITYHNVSYTDILDPLYSKTFIRPTTWTVNLDPTLEDLTYISSLQSSMQTFDIVARQIGYRFRYEGTDLNPRTIGFGEFGVDSGVKLRQYPKSHFDPGQDTLILEQLTIVEDTESIANYLYILGGGGDNGLNQLTLRDVDPSIIDPAYPILIDGNIPNDDTNYDAGVYANTRTGPNNILAYYLEDGTSQSTYGVIKKPVVFSDLLPTPASGEITNADRQNAANELYKAAVQTLKDSKDKHTVYNIICRGNTMNFKVGDTINLKYKGKTKKIVNNEPAIIVWADIQEDLYVTTIDISFDEQGNKRYRLSVSNKPFEIPNDGDLIGDIIDTVNQAQRQRKGSVTTGMTPYKDSLDSSNPAEFLWWIPPETVYIDYLRMKVRVRNFRAYSRATEGGGATTQTSSAGGGATVSSASGGAFVGTSGSGGGIFTTTNDEGTGINAHQHSILVNATSSTNATLDGLGYKYIMVQPGTVGSLSPCPGTAGQLWAANSAGSSSSGNNFKTNCTIDGHNHTFSLPNHSHSVSVPNHIHSVTIPNHTHNITLPNHTHAIQFGIYEDPSPATDIKIFIDGYELTATSEFASFADAFGDYPSSAGDTYNILIAADEIGAAAFDTITSPGEHTIQVTCDSGLTMIELFIFQQLYLSSR